MIHPIANVVAALQTKAAAITGVKAAPIRVPESIHQYPFAVTYLRTGDMKTYSYQLAEVLSTFYVEFHVNRVLLAEAIETAHSIAEEFMVALRDDVTLGNTVDTIEDIGFEFGQLVWANDTNIGIRFSIRVKMEI